MTNRKKPDRKGSLRTRDAAKKIKRNRIVKRKSFSSGAAKTGSRCRKKTAYEQQLSRMCLHMLVNTLQLGIVFEGKDRKIEFVNPAFCKLFGIPSPETILGADCTAMVEQAKSAFSDPEGFVRTVERRKRDKQVVLAEEVKLADGSVVERDYIPISYGQDEFRDYWIYRDISKRKRAEEALRHSEERFKSLYSQAPIGIELYDADGKLLDINPACMKIFGIRSAASVKGLSLFDDPNLSPDIKERLHREESVRYEAVFDFDLVKAKRLYETSRSGECFIEGFISSLNSASGEPIGYLVHVMEITERKKAEAAVKDSEGRLRTLIDAIPDAVFFKDAEGRHVIVNRANERMFGFTPDMMMGKTVEDLLPVEIAATCRKNDEELMKMRTIVRFNERFLDKNGNEQVLDTIKVPLYDDTGNAMGLAGIIRDITEVKKNEELIRQSEQFIRGILDTVDEGFIVVDRNYRIVTSNKAYCKQVGMACEHVVGSECYRVTHHSDRRCDENGEECAVRKVFDTGEPNAALHRHMDIDGHILYVETKAYPIRDTSGNVTSVIETINNITERHLLEEERLKTQKLESIGTLAGGIAHDFNNLLQGVFGYIAVAKLTHDQKEKSLSMLEQAEKALHQSVSLTTQLLTFSKGGKPVKNRMLPLPVIENAAKFALSGSRSELRINCDPDLWQVEADRGQLGQVIQNIVLNATQAMPQGGQVEIIVRNIAVSDAGKPKFLGTRSHILISVRDSGIGIPEQFLSRIFDPYFTTKEKGSGLGLATSYSIIKNHDGLIEVTSEVGKGTTFLIYLPAVEPVFEKTRKEVSSAPLKAGKVLVMDDERIVREVIGELLRVLGNEVVFAEDGEAALTLYREAMETSRPFDVVILDLTVRGGMGGEETIGKLLKMDPGAKVVVSSGYADDSIVSNCRALGFKAFLKKPYNIKEFHNMLSSILG